MAVNVYTQRLSLDVRDRTSGACLLCAARWRKTVVAFLSRTLQAAYTLEVGLPEPRLRISVALQSYYKAFHSFISLILPMSVLDAGCCLVRGPLLPSMSSRA